MTLIAGDLISAARDTHAAFNKERTPPATALRLLWQYAKELHGKIANVDPMLLITDLSIPMPLADYNAGYELPANRYVQEVRAVDGTGSTRQVDLVPFAHRFDHNQRVHVAWTEADFLHLRLPSTRWNDIVSLTVKYVPIPVPLAALTDTVPLPDTAERACVQNLAYAFARRGHTDTSLPPLDPPAILNFKQDAGAAEDDFLADIANRTTGLKFKTRDVWP